MSRRLWTTAIVIIIAVAAVISLSFTVPIEQTPVIAIIVLVVVALAIVALQYLVVNPALLEAAKQDARRYCDAGKIIDPALNKKLCDRLSRAPNDPEAVRLRAELEKLQQKK
jgi:uncharacterized membrane protein (DUF106 family)